MSATPLKQTLSTLGNLNATTVSPYDGGSGAGVEESAADTSNGNSFINNGGDYLIARNSDSSDHTFTLGGKTWTVKAGKNLHLGPFPVFEQFGPTPKIVGSDTHLFLSIFTPDPRGSSKR